MGAFLWIFLALMMVPNVIRVGHHVKVLWSIIGAIFVDVMDHFRSKYRPAEFLFSNQDGSFDVPVRHGSWMTGAFYENAAINHPGLPSLPGGIELARTILKRGATNASAVLDATCSEIVAYSNAPATTVAQACPPGHAIPHIYLGCCGEHSESFTNDVYCTVSAHV